MIEHRATILRSEPALIVRAGAKFETLHNEHGRHAVRHRSERDIGRRKANDTAPFQAEPLNMAGTARYGWPKGLLHKRNTCQTRTGPRKK